MWKKIAVMCSGVLIASSVLVWHRYHHDGVSDQIELDVRRMVQLHPGLEPLFDEAMNDGVLSMVEVERIVEAAEATVEPTD